MLTVAIVCIVVIGLLALNNNYTSQGIMVRIGKYKAMNSNLGLSVDAKEIYLPNRGYVSIGECMDKELVSNDLVILAVNRQAGLNKLYKELEISMG